MQDIYDITIIGGGPVGLFTAFYAGMRQAKVKIIESLGELGGQPLHLYPEKYIYDIPSRPQVSGADLIQGLVSQLEHFETTFCLEEEALDLQVPDEEDDPIQIVTTKQTHYTRAVIIAAGNGAFQPRKIKVPDAEQYEETNLHYYVPTLERFRDQSVAIFGGGDSAVDWALTLEPIAKEVAIIHRRDKFRALEHSVKQLRDSSVNIITPYVADRFEGDAGSIRQLHLNKVRSDDVLQLPVDEVIVNYGFSSSIGTIRDWGLTIERNSIAVNSHYQTNLPRVYAVGDIAQYDQKVKIIATGFGEAPTAVNHALATIYPDERPQVVHSTSLFEEMKQ